MKMRAVKTLQKYGLTEAQFVALYETQKGCCAICGISETDLEQKFSASDWESDRALHIDHAHGSQPVRVRGLLCFQCNFDLEAFIRNAGVTHPGGRGRSVPRKDPRFTKYLGPKGLAAAKARRRTKWRPDMAVFEGDVE